ncbi:ankyrin repeat domain-containing protein [Paenibacillus sp. FSL H3-0469]|uniref:ankyrin repeat domain-containing protein n=1 Tax=Paenibacillus sp. FSL H3-0469 TaxID=2954506 RepID=UPI0031016553
MDQLNQQLWAAVQQGDRDRVTRLLAEGADIDATDSSGRTPAMIAVHTNQLEAFKLLVEQGADIDIRDNRLDNPLLYAGAEGMLDFVKVAIAAGADTSILNRFGGTALIPAAERGHVDVVEELLTTSDVNVNHINNLGWTALLEAVLLGDGGEAHQAIVQLLMDHGADVNLADSEGASPIEHARRSGYLEILEMLTTRAGKSG